MSSTPVATCACASSALSTSGPEQASVPCAGNPSEMSSGPTGPEERLWNEIMLVTVIFICYLCINIIFFKHKIFSNSFLQRQEGINF